MNDKTLDSFESALLTELRDVVAEHPPAPRHRRLVAGIATVATAGAAAVLALVLISPNAAYAVDRDESGDIVVTIHRLEDADQLEADLDESTDWAEVGELVETSYRRTAGVRRVRRLDERG